MTRGVATRLVGESRLPPSILLASEWRAVEDGDGDRVDVCVKGEWRARVNTRQGMCTAAREYAKGECIAAWHAYSFMHGELALDAVVSAHSHSDVNVVCWRDNSRGC